MFVKRILLSALAAVCALSLLAPAPALACGGCHGGRSLRRAAQPCSVEDCTLTGWHYHDRTLYCGHTHGQGLCDGSCCPLCPVEGCTLVGRHVHNGVTYCGANHAEGYCDGTGPCCQASVSSGSRWGGHHGCRR